MERRPPIPIPLKRRWREFRIAYLPVVTFFLLVVAIGWMWSRYVHPADIVGEVETVRANVLSILPGTVVELKVDRLQEVTNGQALAIVAVIEPEVLKAELTAIAADLKLMKARNDLDKTRNLNSASQLRLNLFDEQISLDIAKVRLQQAEGEFERVSKLFQDKIVARGIETSPTGSGTRNDFGYDVALRDRDALRAEVEQRTKTVSRIEKDLQQLETTGVIQITPTDVAVEDTIKAQQARLEQLEKPVVLRSPIDGFVSAVNHRVGERVPAGTPILVVSTGASNRIVAWVRQPVIVRPQVGDVVQVRRALVNQRAAEATVIEVGAQLELINPSLLPVTANPNRPEFGLPFMVTVPAGLDLLPGEAVQLDLKPAQSHRVD